MKDLPNELVLDRVLDAPRAALWRCWTEPALLERWFCPKPWYVTHAVLDLRPGGAFSTTMHGPDGEEFPNTGVFLEVVLGERLVFTDAFAPGWSPSGKPFMTAHVSFEDAGASRTRYVARALHWTPEARAEHEAMGFHSGWNAAADQLEQLAKSL
ncbi:SRPBCC family protein [Paracoccus fontiphilus]|uniref:SRPBCC family protein n=1 Tax=Paracoccus fontiphilus TaxID=1815556 RepID=A0ABV7IEF7_9RHOB|nr:SRPBCC family protein [Paracoccus fontiphilus]